VCSIGPRQTFQHGRRDVRFAPHLVGAGEKLRREGEAERLFEIDDQFQPGVPRALFMGEAVGAVVLVSATTAALWAWACARGQQWIAAEEALGASQEFPCR
jgi:hypothetical protein